MTLCPWPDCTETLTGKAVLCFQHHFTIPAKQARFLIRLKCEAARSGDCDQRRYLEEQIASYTKSAIRKALQQKDVASVE